jgi:hypothetical protein
MRTFGTGATRDSEAGKLDYDGFLSPLTIEAYGRYMDRHRRQADGSLRDSDNWQKGIPRVAYMKSAWRHFMEWWKFHRGLTTAEGIVSACCALIFNVSGYLHEYLKEHPELLAGGPVTDHFEDGGEGGETLPF